MDDVHMTHAHGLFISLEGGEGVGKSTQSRILADRLRALGHEVILTREPGGAPGAEDIRRLLVTGEPGRWHPMSETLLHVAARVEHVAKTVRPALDRGAVVITDRYVDSTRVYQGILQGIGGPVVDELHRIALADLMPDLTLVLDLPSTQGLARANRRLGDEDRYERMGDAFHARLRDAFVALARTHHKRCRLIDASGTEEQVAQAIWPHIQTLVSTR
ncbi:thymidylate kinase [Iodidimonas gelatinilytica]|uniref:Thymidylate kinase n=2 Tax=Iodidimonas gelatinilytica TaxID=1236966 RepID=A0A5A7MZL7_9PROT|nr:dTMP kinase [Iodidimonas gelatinilytica]GEQ96787.1 thymidylate kinase [Iodidimonas gelatinilytica]GER01227.1 thymidylate kinase [Iodidimonas gelatinilytica]